MTKIPSSLNWLVRRRARLKGLIEAGEREIAKLAKLNDRLSGLRLDLEALDRVFSFHEIPIDPTTIPSIHVSIEVKIRMKTWFPHGALSRALVAALASSETGYMTTKQLAQDLLLDVHRRHPNEVINRYEQKRFHDLVRYRLKALCNIGRLKRVRPAQEVQETGGEQGWILSTRTDFDFPEAPIHRRSK